MKINNKDKTHCPKGHPYSAENTYITSEGGRKCRTCKKEKYLIDRRLRSLSRTASPLQSQTEIDKSIHSSFQQE